MGSPSPTAASFLDPKTPFSVSGGFCLHVGFGVSNGGRPPDLCIIADFLHGWRLPFLFCGFLDDITTFNVFRPQHPSPKVSDKLKIIAPATASVAFIPPDFRKPTTVSHRDNLFSAPRAITRVYCHSSSTAATSAISPSAGSISP